MISQPLVYLDRLQTEQLAADGSNHQQPTNIAERFLARLGPDARVPCLNEMPRTALRQETVVKFRGMVQATLEPELYHKACGHFRDRHADSADEVDPDTRPPLAGWANVLGERQRCLCVPVPHETAWLKADLTARDRLDEAELSSLYAGLSVLDHDAGAQKQQATGEPTESKKAKIDDEQSDSCCRGWDGVTVELLVYSEDCDLRVHDLVETVAVLSVGDSRQNSSETETATPNTALRLHALSHRRLASQVPPATRACTSTSTSEADDAQWVFLRTALLGVFADLLLGDTLAAEYLLLHLVSAVYRRGINSEELGSGDGLAVGKLSLNLACCRPQVARHLGRLIDLLVPRLYRTPLSLRFLNTAQLTPRLDCDTCHLRPGLLQMPVHTQLLLDETALETGRLDETGLGNLRAIGQLVRDQTVQFDLQMYKKDFETDIRVLVVSQSKSLLPCDLLLPLEPRHFVSEAAAEEDFNRLMDKVTLDTPFLRESRRYLAGVGYLAANGSGGVEETYLVGAEAQVWIEEDFVRKRQSARAAAAAAATADASAAASVGVTAEDLGFRLVLCRLLTLSLGRSQPTREIWDRVSRMEEERKRRVLRASKNA